jgi:hypothetical protein
MEQLDDKGKPLSSRKGLAMLKVWLIGPRLTLNDLYRRFNVILVARDETH